MNSTHHPADRIIRAAGAYADAYSAAGCRPGSGSLRTLG